MRKLGRLARWPAYQLLAGHKHARAIDRGKIQSASKPRARRGGAAPVAWGTVVASARPGIRPGA